jgi:hypothetical protein
MKNTLYSRTSVFNTVLLAVAMAFTLSLPSCKDPEDAKPTHLPIKFPYTKTFTVDSAYMAGTQIFFQDTVNSVTRDEFKVLATVIDQLDTITIEKITVEMVTANQNFDAYTSVNVIIAAEGLPTIEIARNNNLPRSATTVTLEVPRHDILAYIRKENFFISITGQSNVPTPVRLDMKALMKFRALARIGK